MGKAKDLNKSKEARDDEFYTLYDDIAAELPKYKEQFRGKRILCPCDWDESYEEELIFLNEEQATSSDLFSSGTIKEIDIAKSKERIEKDINLIKCNFAKFLIAHADAYGIKSISVSGYNPATGEGVKFQDIDYSKYDIVATNPPFSLIQEFLITMMENNMKFIVIGPLTALARKELFTRYFKDNKIWLGYAKQMIGFARPDGSILYSKNPEGSVPRACKWYTNLDVTYRHDKKILTESYYENPEKFPKYINYDAIHIPSLKEIPYDYDGLMGVPSTIVGCLNPDQFEIVAISGVVGQKPDIPLPKSQQGGPAFYTMKNGQPHREFTKYVIRNKNPYRDDES